MRDARGIEAVDVGTARDAAGVVGGGAVGKPVGQDKIEHLPGARMGEAWHGHHRGRAGAEPRGQRRAGEQADDQPANGSGIPQGLGVKLAVDCADNGKKTPPGGCAWRHPRAGNPD